MTQQRLLGADFLRASACLLVLFHHLAFRMDGRFIPDYARGIMQFLIMGSFGVTVFFMLSGFLLARPFWMALDAGQPMPSLRVYALRRAARILPGFWLALIVSFVLSIVVSGSRLDGELVLRFAAGFFLVSDWHWLTLFPVDNNGPLWSIGFEVTSYALLPLCLAGLFATGLRGVAARLAWLAIIGLVLVVHAMIVAWAPIDEVQRGWSYGLVGGAKAWMPRFNPIGFFAIFALGALAAGLQVLVSRLKHWGFDAIGAAAVLAAGWIIFDHIGRQTEGFGWLGIPYAFPTMPLVIGVALIALPSSVFVGWLLDNRLTRYLAEISFGIYIWHFLIIGLMARLWPPSFDTNREDGWTVWLASSAGAIVISIACATVSFRLMEQPVVRWARGLENRARPTLDASSGSLSTS